MDTLGPHLFASNTEAFLFEREKCIEVGLLGFVLSSEVSIKGVFQEKFQCMNAK